MALCPTCGAVVAGAGATPGDSPLRRRLPYYGAAAALVLVATGVFLYLGRDECRGGARAEVEWIVEPGSAPARATGIPFELEDPLGVPHIELARLRTYGTPLYGKNMMAHTGHYHGDLLARIRETGGNAWIAASADKVGGGRVEVISIAAYVYAGAITEAQRARFAGPRACMLIGVTPGSPIDRAGARTGDVVLEIAGAPFPAESDDCAELVNRLAQVAPGAPVEVRVFRAGTEATLALTRPERGLYGYRTHSVPVGPPS